MFKVSIKIIIKIVVREGLKKANYPNFVDKGGGSSNVDKRWKRGGGNGVGIKKILNWVIRKRDC